MSNKLDLLIEQFGFEKEKETIRDYVDIKLIEINGQMVEVKVYAEPTRKQSHMRINERRQNRSGHRERIGGDC